MHRRPRSSWTTDVVSSFGATTEVASRDAPSSHFPVRRLKHFIARFLVFHPVLFRRPRAIVVAIPFAFFRVAARALGTRARAATSASASIISTSTPPRAMANARDVAKSDRTRIVLWFRNDLRVHDNACIERAMMLRASANAEVVPVYAFDGTFFKNSVRGQARFGAARGKFTLEALRDLKHTLKGLGSDLLVRVGASEDVVAALTLTGANERTIILVQTEVTSEETDMDRRAEEKCKEVARRGGGEVRFERIWGSTLYHVDDLPFALSDLPDVFTPFRNKVESKCAVRKLLPKPAMGALGSVPASAGDFDWFPKPSDLPFATPKLAQECVKLIADGADERRALDFKGGESQALARVKYYLWESKLLETYFDTRNGMLGGDYSTKLAPWLALGCVSPRYVVSEIRKYESEIVENKSTYWVIFELIWRDFFKFFALKYGNKIFHLHGTTANRNAAWREDDDALEAWKSGMTGYPLIDANMRELKYTGFMSNRGRQNVASWLALDAGVDWRHGADWFEHYLIDYDTASNWGNWCAAAGMTGGRINRFNIVKQTKDYDPEGEYIRHWVPELKDVPTAHIADPSQMPREIRDKINLTYPNKIKLPQRSYTEFGSVPGPKRGGGGGGRGGGRGRGPKSVSRRPQSIYESVYG